jgi:Uma2 family endonuclease
MIAVQKKLGPRIADLRSVDLPYTLRLFGVSEEQFDELVDEDTRAELIDGVMIVHSPASIKHDNLSGFLRFLMRGFSEHSDAGIVLGPDSLIRLRPRRRVGPDLFFIERRRVPRRLPREWKGTPDLVLEVLSPSNRREDVAEKLPTYREAAVREIWLIDPDEREVLVEYRRGKSYGTSHISAGRVASTVLKGFWLDASWLWKEPLPNVMACLREILG